MASDSILEFKPVFKETVWGGRKLQKILKKDLPEQGTFGESWEIVDLPSEQSVLCSKNLVGKTLGQIRAESQKELLGSVSLLEGRFPLLFKFIDAQETLSVQVHPDEHACANLCAGARPKTEAWYIIDRAPGAVLYVGLKKGVDRQTFEKAIKNGTVEGLLHQKRVEPNDFIYLPSGTVHAIGKGILLAEVQQSSDTTYRVFDWNRMGLDGKPRQLHVEQALESIHFNESQEPTYDSPASGRPGIYCSDFSIELFELNDADEIALKDKGPIVIMGVEGSGTAKIIAGRDTSFVKTGQTRLIPAILASNIKLSSSGKISLLATRIPT